VHRQIRLLISLQVELGNWNSTWHRRLEYGCANNLPLPFDFTRKSYIDGQEFHGVTTRDTGENALMQA
jgi:hypothetical protein